MFGRCGKDNPTSKRVINITTGKIYDSATICAEKENKNLSHICAVCRGDRGSTGYNIYRYLDDNGNIIEPDKKSKIKHRPVRNIETYESAVLASIDICGNKNNAANINKVCNNERKTALKYHWEFC